MNMRSKAQLTMSSTIESSSSVQSKTNPSGPSGPLQGQKSLFRIPMYRSSGTSTSSTSEQSTKRAYHPRRSHRKSRSGCLVCKTRRVKCDESKPHCLRCQKHGVTCVYADLADCASDGKGAVPPIEKETGVVSPNSRVYSMHLLEVSEKIDGLLRLGSKKRHLPDAVGALHHFLDATTPTVGTPRTRKLLRNQMIQLAFQTPLVMHTVIAVATSHLSHTVPDSTPYRVAEAYHWQQTISQYSKELSRGVGPVNMDGLFSTCLLMTVHSFALDKYNPRQSFVFSDDPAALSWLILQGGLRHLLGLTKPWLGSSMWLDVFITNVEETLIFNDSPGRVDLHPELADLCGIEDTSTEETNPYLSPLRMLTALLRVERSMASFSRYTTFMGRLLPGFWDRLAEKDPPALIILGWWLALMDSVGLWWAETRIRSECAAICMYLEDSEDPRILKLLEFPAAVAGYLLKHVQRRAWEEDPLLSVDMALALDDI